MMKNKLIPAIILMTVLCMGCGSTSNETESNEAASQTQVVSYGDFKINNIGPFKTVDMDGNTVTEAIFAEKEYTLINVWGTFCGPCINEMPELQGINASLPDNFQIVGIVCDVPDDVPESRKAAIEIINKTGVTYTNLAVSEDMNYWFDIIQYVPTTILVDSNGNVVTEIIEGAYVDGYKQIIEQFGK